jgi:hypothetical protein
MNRPRLQVRQNLDTTFFIVAEVRDPTIRSALILDYPCKRIGQTHLAAKDDTLKSRIT